MPGTIKVLTKSDFTFVIGPKSRRYDGLMQVCIISHALYKLHVGLFDVDIILIALFWDCRLKQTLLMLS